MNDDEIKQALKMSIQQVKKIEDIDKQLKRLITKYNKALSGEPEDSIRLLAALQELTREQMRLSEYLGGKL